MMTFASSIVLPEIASVPAWVAISGIVSGVSALVVNRVYLVGISVTLAGLMFIGSAVGLILYAEKEWVEMQQETVGAIAETVVEFEDSLGLSALVMRFRLHCTN